MLAVECLCAHLILLIVAIRADDAILPFIEEICSGLKPILLNEETYNFNKRRWFLYKATAITEPDIPEYCGLLDPASGDCKCTGFDSFKYNNLVNTVIFSYNKKSSRLDTHLFQIDFPYRPLVFYFWQDDFRLNFNITTLNPISDEYQTYYVTVACNINDGPPFFGKRAVWVFTSSPTPSTNTTQAIAQALADNYITEELMYIDQYGCKDVYPASTYTTPDTQYYTD